MIGLNAVTYYGDAGAAAASVTDELDILKEISYDESADDAVAGYRDSRYKSHDVGLIDITGSGTLKNVPTHDGFVAIREAFHAGTPLAFKILDKAAGAGLLLDVVITAFSGAQPIDGKIEATFSWACNTDLREPVWVEAAGGGGGGGGGGT